METFAWCFSRCLSLRQIRSQRCSAASVETEKKIKRETKRRKEYAIRCAHVQVNRKRIRVSVRVFRERF